MMKNNNPKKNKSEVILAIFPNARGFGYALIDAVEKPIDYGMVNPQEKKISHFRERFQFLVDVYRPQIVILEDCEQSKTKSKRIKKLIALFRREASDQGLIVCSYTRQQIREVFLNFEAITKYEISKVIVRWIPELKPFVPNKRKAWEAEASQMGIFDAFSLAMTYYYEEG